MEKLHYGSVIVAKLRVPNIGDVHISYLNLYFLSSHHLHSMFHSFQGLR